MHPNKERYPTWYYRGDQKSQLFLFTKLRINSAVDSLAATDNCNLAMCSNHIRRRSFPWHISSDWKEKYIEKVPKGPETGKLKVVLYFWTKLNSWQASLVFKNFKYSCAIWSTGGVLLSSRTLLFVPRGQIWEQSFRVIGDKHEKFSIIKRKQFPFSHRLSIYSLRHLNWRWELNVM